MDAALEIMHSLRQAGDLELAALKDASAGHLDVPEAAGTFRNRRLAVVEGRYETTPEFRHLGEGVRLTALRKNVARRRVVGILMAAALPRRGTDVTPAAPPVKAGKPVTARTSGRRVQCRQRRSATRVARAQRTFNKERTRCSWGQAL